MSEPETNPLAAALDAPVDAPMLGHPGEFHQDGERRERPPFPRGGPVKCLGISSDIAGSQKCYYLNHNGQIVGLEAGNKHGKNSLIALYGPSSDFLEAEWPQWSAPQFEGRGAARKVVKKSEIVGFDQADASRCHIEECVRKGIFDPTGRMRGRGAHAVAGGAGLVLHCGDALLTSIHRADGTIKGWTWTEVGLHDRYVYTAGAPIPRPWHEEVGEYAGVKLFAYLREWNWKRPLIDARLLLGWCALAPFGGALAWRPNIWITGGRGTGKSTLNGEGGVFVRMLGEGLFHTGNASAAAIRQTLKNSTVPVMIDEIEASRDNRAVDAVVELARIASSGGTVHRGSQDHTAMEFTLRSAFQFSSINIPPLEPQDRSRLAILELKKIPAGKAPPVLESWGLPELGKKMQRRMVDEWHRLAATKAKFHAALSAMGHDARACDQFGTLLAGADCVLNSHGTADGLPPDEEVNEWARKLRPDRMAEVSEATPDEEACLHHLLTSQVQARGGDERETVGSWIGKAVGTAIAPLLSQETGMPDQERSERRLRQMGLMLVNPVWKEATDKQPARWGYTEYQEHEPGFLAVGSGHQILAKLFEGTKWQGGVHRQSLGRCEGAIADGVKVKFERAVSLRAVLVPLHYLLDEDELPAASKPEALAAWMEGKGA